MAPDAKEYLFLCHKGIFWLLPVEVKILIQTDYIYITVLMRSYEELVKLLNIKTIEKSAYKQISRRKKNDRAFILA